MSLSCSGVPGALEPLPSAALLFSPSAFLPSFFSPLSFSPLSPLRCLARSSGEALLMNAIILPSGDHTGLPAPLGRSVIRQDSPPFIGNIYSCGPEGRTAPLLLVPPAGDSGVRTKTIHLPSGDQRG